MLNNIASYLGYQLSPADLEPDVAENVQVSAVEDDEWLLVERLDSEPAVREAVGLSPDALPGADAAPMRSSMQESWYLTPPPSFSRGPVHVITSPLENLLIEHPSMSVYQKSSKSDRRKVGNSSRSTSEDLSEEGSDKPEKCSKVPRHKYSKKTWMKRANAASSDDALSLPLTSEDEDKIDVQLKNFVKSPYKALPKAKAVKVPCYRRPEARPGCVASTELMSTKGDDEFAGAIPLSAVPTVPRRLYSDVARMQPPSLPEPLPLPEPSSLPKPSSSPKPSSLALAVKELLHGSELSDDEIYVPSPAALRAAAAMFRAEANFRSTENPPPFGIIRRCPRVKLVVREYVPEPSVPSECHRVPSVPRERRPAALLTPPTPHQTFLNRSAQKLEKRKTFELSKRTMGRNNKAREINSRNKRQRRSDMMQRHSGVNNNRKCC